MNRRFDRRADVRSRDGSAAIRDRLKLRIEGPWEEPRWSVDGQIQLPESMGLNTALTLDGQWRTPWREPQRDAVLLDRLQLSAPGLSFGLSGTVGNNLNLRSTELQIDPRFWSGVPSLQAGLGQTAPILGDVDIRGALTSPEVTLTVGQAANPLLKHWSFQTRWAAADSVLVLIIQPDPAGGSTFPWNWRRVALKPVN